MITSIDPQNQLIVVDDDPLYTRLVELVLKSLKYPGEAKFFTDPTQLMPFLAAHPARPRLILLDMSMPQMNGFTLLKTLRGVPATKAIPVIVMSGNGDDQMVKEAYLNGANSWVQKPDELDDFFSVFQKILEYWLSLSEIPQD